MAAAGLPTVSGEFGVVGNPDPKFTSEGKMWLKIRGGAKKRKRGPDGVWTDGPSTFIDILVFGPNATNLVESGLKSGDSIVVTGELEMTSSEHEGSTRYYYQILADQIGMSTRWRNYGTGQPMNIDEIKSTLGAEEAQDAPW